MLLIVEQVKSMIASHKDIDQSQPTIVNFDSYNDSSIDFLSLHMQTQLNGSNITK